MSNYDHFMIPWGEGFTELWDRGGEGERGEGRGERGGWRGQGRGGGERRRGRSGGEGEGGGKEQIVG